MTGYVVATGVGSIDEGDAVYVAYLPDGPILELRGTAALIWREALEGPRETLAERISSAVVARPADVSVDVMAFIELMVAKGLIAAAPVGDTEHIR